MTPDRHTIREFLIEVGDGHSVYVQDWGSAEATTPILYLHGGPGNGCSDRDKRGFDPETQRVIFFDQRGSGRSTPAGSLEENTTPKLIEDIETIAEELKVQRFVIVGGSWGSTLALAYGISHPERVSGMVLNGIFTASKREMDWLGKGLWRQFYPEIWQQYLARTPEAHRRDPSSYHFEQVLSGSPVEAKKSAYAYEAMELSLLKLDEIYQPEPFETYEPDAIRIEIHYDANNCFLNEGYILDNATRLTMPVYLIVGRYDMVTPPLTAYELAQELPNGHIIWTINGHLRGHEARNIQHLLINQLLGNS